MKENKIYSNKNIRKLDDIFKNAVEDYRENDDLITAMNLALYYRGKEKEESKELFNRVLKKRY